MGDARRHRTALRTSKAMPLLAVLAGSKSLDAKKKRTAENRLRLFVGMKYAAGSWPATDVCELAWRVSECGIKGLRSLAYNPHSEHFQKNASRVCRVAFKMSTIEAIQEKVQIPIIDEESAARVWYDSPVASLGSLLADQFLRAPEALIQEASALGIQNWTGHAVKASAEAAGDWAIPFGMFVDAAAWKGKGAGTRDSLICWYVNLIGRSTRRTVFTLRKDIMCGECCGCSCKGRCTIDSFERHFAWQCDQASPLPAPFPFPFAFPAFVRSPSIIVRCIIASCFSISLGRPLPVSSPALATEVYRHQAPQPIARGLFSVGERLGLASWRQVAN